MSDQNLAISFSLSSLGEDESWWVRLEQVSFEPDLASVEDAAEAIDAIFELDPCVDETALTGGESAPITEDGTLEPPMDVVDFHALMAFILGHSNYDPCKIINDGSYETDVRLYRSHVNEPYVLKIINGELLQTIIVSENISISILVEGDSITLEKPIHSMLVSSFEVQSVQGSTVNFVSEVNGYVNFTYLSQHDLLTIKVNPPAEYVEEADPCNCIVFYAKMVQELELQPPEDDSDAKELFGCDYTIVTNVTPDTVGCYKLTYHLIKCQCTGEEVLRTPVEEAIPCPEGVDSCGPFATNCRRQIGPTLALTTGYVDCGGGSFDTSLNDPVYYEEKCCYPPQFPLPKCNTITSIFQGGKGIKNGVEHHRSIYGGNTRFVAVSPKDGVCGEVITRQEVHAIDCCDDATPLIWDSINSVQVITDDSSGVVVVTGGLRPLTVSVRGSGFWLDANHTIRDGISSSADIAIYTSDACGMCAVIITDGCSTVSGKVRSDDGNYDGTCYAYCCDSGGEHAWTWAFDITLDPLCAGLYQSGMGMRYASTCFFSVWMWNGIKWIFYTGMTGQLVSDSSFAVAVALVADYYHISGPNDTTEPVDVNPCGCTWIC